MVKILAPYVKRCDLYIARIQTHTQTYIQRKNWGRITFFSMAQMVECSLTMWKVLGSKHSWVCVFVVVDVRDIFSIFRKWCKNHFFQKTNYQGTWVLWCRCLIWILLLLLFQTTEKTCFSLKWKKGHNSPKFQNYYKMIVSAS